MKRSLVYAEVESQLPMDFLHSRCDVSKSCNVMLRDEALCANKRGSVLHDLPKHPND